MEKRNYCYITKYFANDAIERLKSEFSIVLDTSLIYQVSTQLNAAIKRANLKYVYTTIRFTDGKELTGYFREKDMKELRECLGIKQINT